MRRHIIAVLGAVAVAAPAYAQQQSSAANGSSTYVPGATNGRGGDVGSYSVRGSAVRDSSAESARGGGPRSDGDASSRATRMEAQGRLRGRAMSDNQTRRPGAVNYTAGVRFTPDRSGTGGGPRSQHSVPDADQGVSMQGDRFTRTGSPSRGRIPVRAPSSNEREMRGAPSGRGGGPSSSRGVRLGPVVDGSMRRIVLPDGDRDVTAVSGPITWGVEEPRGAEWLQPPVKSLLTADDLAQLPSPGDGGARAGSGLLSSRDRVRSHELNDAAALTASAPGVIDAPEPVATPGATSPMSATPPSAVGGGPRSRR